MAALTEESAWVNHSRVRKEDAELSKVTIYQFTLYDIANDEARKSRRWGTLEGIRAVCGAVLEDTVTEIDASEVASEIPV